MIDEHKKSFAPISDSKTTILILGTLPGDKSIALQEYYGHPRNRFWKIILQLTGHELPTTYDEKKSLLIKINVGIWDVAHKAKRKGSLDQAIEEEEPNDLARFVSEHPTIKVIGFNGQKAEKLFDKYFNRRKDINYISLPSTSPANASVNFENMCHKWKLVFHINQPTQNLKLTK